MKTKLSHTQLLPKYHLDIKAVTSYSAHHLFFRNWYDIDYNVILSNGKSLQRDFVWTIQQKRELILSMIKGLQLPNFCAVLYDPEDNINLKRLKIIDGKQRLSTIEQFVHNRFGIMFEGVEYFYDDLDKDTQHKVGCLSLQFNIVYEFPDEKLTDEQLISWFELVNFAGTPQDVEHLNYLKG